MKRRAIALLTALLILLLTACGTQPAQQSELPVPVVSGSGAEQTQEPEPSLQAIPGSSETDLSYSELYPASSTDMTMLLPYSLGEGLELTRIGSYSGLRADAGELEQVRDVFAVTVKNSGASLLRHAEFTVTTSAGTASFVLDCLPGGASADICAAEGGGLGIGGSFTGAELMNAAFESEPGLGGLEYEYGAGSIAVTNTGKDLDGDIAISCRIRGSANWLGASALEFKLEGGLASGETKAIDVPILSGLTLEAVDARYC